MNTLIKRYIEKLTTNDILNFASKNNISLSDNELKYIYNIIKNDYDKLLKLNHDQVFKNLKKNVSDENYEKITNLYFKYKDMYSYLL